MVARPADSRPRTAGNDSAKGGVCVTLREARRPSPPDESTDATSRPTVTVVTAAVTVVTVAVATVSIIAV